jgi:hydroxymethylpyrimidine/phosphomethylpyrimidine kinase
MIGRVYVVTDPDAPIPVPDQARAAARGGVWAVQIRDKRAPDDAIARLAEALLAELLPLGVRVFVNDRVEVARATGADLHIGQGDGDPRAARDRIAPEALLGLSVETAAHCGRIPRRSVLHRRGAVPGDGDEARRGPGHQRGGACAHRRRRPGAHHRHRRAHGRRRARAAAGRCGRHGRRFGRDAGGGSAGRDPIPSRGMERAMIPNILSIAGSDPSGGAGIQADLKAISANGGYGMAAITALTVQNTRGVRDVALIAPAMVAAQIAAIREDIRIDAVKIGMLGSAAIVAAVAEALADLSAPIVLDPVMVAKGGDRLLAPDAVAALRDRLLPMATVVTPNLPESADLLGMAMATTREEMTAQAQALLALGPGAVLLKGGHLPGGDSPDLLIDASGAHWVEGARIATGNTHGTGCTLSSALAARIGQGLPLPAAVARAKSYIAGAIARADDLSVGSGHGPVHHFHAFNRETA